MEYNLNTMKDALLAFVMIYKELGIHNMILRNSHMNEYDEEEFDETLALELLNQFIDAALPYIKLDSPSIIDIANGLVKGISFLNECEIILPTQVKEAILVDYINYVAGSHGLDYGMHTKDIIVEEE